MSSSLISRLVCQTARTTWFTGRPTVRLLNQVSSRHCPGLYFSTSGFRNSKESSKDDKDDELDKPIPFSTSKASQISAHDNLSGDPFPNSPWYQPYVVNISVALFLIYFLALREENDFDEYMDTPLWDKVPGLEKQQLQVVLEYNRNNGLETKDIERRIRELEMNPASPPPRIVKPAA